MDSKLQNNQTVIQRINLGWCEFKQRHEDVCPCPYCKQKRKEVYLEIEKEVKWKKKTCFHEPYEMTPRLWVCVKCSILIPMPQLTERRKG